ncbi:hypothetical protein [Aquipuribacter sp. MA13-6]|uniref:hypothetical protein n=1 Tax=unclassified Aquipuribacter TaxID=2635084 RepID=UPI003EE8D125
MNGAGGARLVVDADLTVQVRDPRGRTATVVVDDHGGAVRVRVAGPADLPVLLGSLPRPGAGGRGAAQALHALRPGAGPGGLRWDQDVEVLLGRRLLLRRRDGRWRPTPTAVVPVALAATSALVATGVAVSVVVLLVRRVLGALARRRPGGGATG